MKTRKEKCESALEYISNYLDDAGWPVDDKTLFRVDPVSGGKYSADTAFVIQLGRDIVYGK